MGRKFALCVAYWFFCFAGAAILYLSEAVTFEDSRLLYNDALEWALYGFYGFAGIEGTKEIVDSVRSKKQPKTETDGSNEQTGGD